MNTRWTKTSVNSSPYRMTRSPYHLTYFINIDGLLIESNYTVPQENTFFVALTCSILSTTHKCWENWIADTGTYSEMFSSILRYFLQVIFKVTYVGLLHYGFVTLRRNHSHLILEHVCCTYHWNHFQKWLYPYITWSIK